MSLQDMVDSYKGPITALPRDYNEITPTPIYEGGNYGYHPTQGIVPLPPEQPDMSPGADPAPILNKQQIKAIEPVHNRILQLASGYGEDHMIAPGSQEMVDALGIGAKAHGIDNHWLYNLPGIGKVARAISPQAQSVLNTQEAASQAYALALKAKMQETLSGPNTVGEAQRLGIPVPYTPEQQANTIEDPRVNQPYEAHGLSEIQRAMLPRIVNPNQNLTLPQQIGVTGPYMKGLAAGNIVATPQGIMPSYMAGMAAVPRTVNSDSIQQAVNGLLPPGEDGEPQMIVPPGNHPTAFADAIINAAQRQRAIGMSNLGPRLESLAVGAGYQTARALQKANPVLFNTFREQAMKEEPLDIYGAQQDAQAKRQINVAGPIVNEQAEAHRNQPVLEPQLWRDPVSGRAASPQMTENQARTQNFVKLRPDQVETFNQLSTIDNGLQEVKTLAKGLFTPETGSVGAEILRTVGQRGYLAYLRGVGDKRIVKMDSIVSRLTAPLVKSQGDTANIAVAERQMFASALVNNNASLEAILGNLDNVVDMTKNARKLMGFQSREDFVHSMIQQGMTKEQILNVLKKKGL
jgi:hypothetical protein